MDEYGTSKKKYVFYDHDHLHAKLIVKLMEDGIKQGILFREFLKAYSEDNPDIRKWVENNPNMKISNRSIAKRKMQQRKLELINKKFNLDQKEVDEIFDILADEFGD